MALGEPSPSGVNGAYEASFDTCADMSHLIKREEWDSKHIAYFCSVMPEPEAPGQGAADAALKEDVRRFVKEQLPGLWPGFSPDDLVDTEGRPGLDRLGAQFWRANVAPQERYVQSPAGSIAARLAPEWDGFGHMVLAGDWTKTGIDAGCVEAAVSSGRRAGRELVRRAGRS